MKRHQSDLGLDDCRQVLVSRVPAAQSVHRHEPLVHRINTEEEPLQCARAEQNGLVGLAEDDQVGYRLAIDADEGAANRALDTPAVREDKRPRTVRLDPEASE